MKLILQTDVKNLGKTGDQVSVKKGFARNYLIPKGYAVLMNKNRLKAWEHQKVIIEAKKRKAISERQSLIEKLSSIKLKFKKEAQKDNRLFGSVTAHEISQSLEKLHNLSVDKRDIHFTELKTVGEHSVMIKLDSENQTEIKLSIKGIVRKSEYKTQMDPQELKQEAEAKTEKEKKDNNLLDLDVKKISDSDIITDTQLKPESLKKELNEKLEKEPVKKVEEENQEKAEKAEEENQEKAEAKSSDAKENTNINKNLDTASIKSSGAGKSLKKESANTDSESEYLNQQTEDIKETKAVKNLSDPKNDESQLTTVASDLKKEIKNSEPLKQDTPKKRSET